jgi:hypothetical protein
MSNINILRQFNQQVNNSLYIENINYLDNLHDIVINSIKTLSQFNINDNVFTEIKLLYGNEYTTSQYNELCKITTINFLKTTSDTIYKLKQNPIQETNKQTRDEYVIFHNNIVSKIKVFINTYIGYIQIIESINSKIQQTLSDEINKINILISNYNSNLMYHTDPNFSSRHSRLLSSINLLKQQQQYLDNNINNFISIRNSFKTIDTKFLKML